MNKQQMKELELTKDHERHVLSRISESDAMLLRDNLSKFDNEFGASQVQRKMIMGYSRAVNTLEQAAVNGYILRTDKPWLFSKATQPCTYPDCRCPLDLPHKDSPCAIGRNKDS